jgi:Fe2+ transport system protein FeoA
MTPTPPPGTAAWIALTDARRDDAWRVVAITADDVDELLAEGLVTGTVVTPESRAPFRGPVIVRVGRARVAVAQAVASRVLVEPVERSAADLR